MTTATNIDATAVNTISWLSTIDATIVVPVYQRQYRWDIGGCEQLLADVRTVADTDPHHMHFIGSVLSSLSAEAGELVLIDGQQRITTLMLLVAALHDTVRAEHPALADELRRVLTGPDGRTRLRPHRAWADVFESVVFDRRPAGGPLRDSRFDDNYAFFRSRISLEDAPRVWRGLQKLEHVAITLGAGANAQQIFASLNSTGEPLRDHELIHNYVLMGLSHDEQREIEDEFWLPIERNTGEAIGAFWRHYMVMTTGREVAASGEHGVYGEFRTRFPRLDAAALRAHAAQWRECSEVYRALLDPSSETDAELAAQLAHLQTFGKGMNPLVMRAVLSHRAGAIDRTALIATLEEVQALLMRRAVAGLSNDRLAARLCRAHAEGEGNRPRTSACAQRCGSPSSPIPPTRCRGSRAGGCRGTSPSTRSSRSPPPRRGRATACARGATTPTTSRTVIAPSRRRSAISPSSRMISPCVLSTSLSPTSGMRPTRAATWP
jgi:hypothetical protein